jgi:hypothetical protein
MDQLSEKKQSNISEMMADFATYECNRYISGEITYEELDVIYDAINDLEGYDFFTDPYYAEANSIELIQIYQEGVNAFIANGYVENSYYQDLQDEFTVVYYKTDDTDSVNEVLIAYLQEKYQAYQNGDLSWDDMDAYAWTAWEFWYGEALQTAGDIMDELETIQEYESVLENAQEYIDQEDYFGAVEYCDDELYWMSEDDTTGYREKLQALRDEAYEAGKTYYIEKASNLVADNDYDGARELLSQIKELYGDEVDTSAVEASMKEPWMDVYVAFMANWEESLRADVAAGVAIGDLSNSSQVNVDENLPTQVYLYDFDGNGTPELALGGGDYLYIYGFNGSDAVLTGAIQVAGFCAAPYLIGVPTAMEDGYTGYMLLQFDSNEWSVVEYYEAATDGSVYLVNGEESTYEECEAMYNDIAGYEDTTEADKVNGADISDYEEFIYSYGQ